MVMCQERAEILGCRVDLVDMTKTLQIIEDAIQKRELSQVITLNAEMIYRAQNNQKLRETYAQARLVTPDGIGVIWALRRAGYNINRRVTGIDLTLKILEMARENNWSVFLLGAEPGVAEIVAQQLTQSDPISIAGVHHGYFTDEESQEIIELIRATMPDILLVALGAPRQDIWIANHIGELKVPVCIGVGGTFDVLAGKVKRAPKIWRRLGLEWLFRLLSEPTRIKRQMALPRFAWLILKKGRKKKWQQS